MKYKAKSIIVCRRKESPENDEYPYMVEVKLFKINDAHKTVEVPTKTLEFHNVMSVVFKNHDVKYLPRGSDIVVNDLKEIDVSQNEHKIIIE
ncbi:MAG: hypothetical protein WC471_04310 [Candidatus Woesearchaeota archaeon]